MMRYSVDRAAAVFLVVVTALFSAPRIEAAGRTLPRILVFEAELRGSDDSALRWPIAVAVASEEEFAVADARPPRVEVFSKVGSSWAWSQTIPLPGPPIALVHDGSRYVVGMRGEDGLMALEGEKRLMRKIGLPDGVVPGAMAPWASGGLLVYDLAGGRVMKLDSKGNRMAEIAIDGRVTAVATGPGGEAWVAVGEHSAVLRFDPNGAMTTRVEVPGEGPVPAWPAGLAVDASGDLVVVDRHTARILIFDDRGSAVGVGARRGSEPGLLRYPRAVDVLPDGSVLVGDEGNGRAQLFRRSDRTDGS